MTSEFDDPVRQHTRERQDRAREKQLPANVKYYEVPIGTRSRPCNGDTCQQLVYFIKSPKSGKPLPIDCDVDGGSEPTSTAPGRGVSHFVTCPDRDRFKTR